MPTENAVIEHLQLARDALLADVARLTDELQRLNAAVDEVDSVMARLGTAGAGSTPTRAAATRTTTPRKSTRRRAAAAKPADSGSGGTGGGSIRSNVLEILGSEDRDFGLAEVIDRIAALGIQAHDDAVRSITIKLMKDGKVERVGRGQYRLAGRTSAPAESPAQPPAEATPAPEAGYVPAMDFNQDPGY